MRKSGEHGYLYELIDSPVNDLPVTAACERANGVRASFEPDEAMFYRFRRSANRCVRVAFLNSLWGTKIGSESLLTGITSLLVCVQPDTRENKQQGKKQVALLAFFLERSFTNDQTYC